jgi:RNA polymerase sigma-70 factor (ECF subfamily)
VARSLAGDAAAFEALVARYERVLFNVAYRMLGNRDDAADATQTAFVRAFERLESYKSGFKFFSWIYRILSNECLNQIRARHPQEPLTPDVAHVDGPLERLEGEELQRQVQAALLSLDPDYRAVITLRHFAELSYDQMSDALGIPVKTVKSRLYTARQRLAERLLR